MKLSTKSQFNPICIYKAKHIKTTKVVQSAVQKKYNA